MKRERVRLSILALILCLSACGGGGGVAPTVQSTPQVTPTPTPTATPAAASVSPTSVNLVGSGSSQSVAIVDPDYSGALTIDAKMCASIATVSSASVQGPNATFTVTAAQQGGTCTISLSDTHGQNLSLPVSVTVTQGVIQ